MNNIKAELERIINRYGLKVPVLAVSVCQIFEYEAAQIFPREILAPVEAVSFSEGVIKISVPSSNYAQALHWREPELLERINKKSAQKVERMRIIIK